MRTLFLFILLVMSNIMVAIDICRQYKFNPEEIVGKQIIIPTFDGGKSNINFVFNMNVLDNNKFTYENYSTLKVLGTPIYVSGYRIINKGKKNAILCIIVEKNGESAVLYFPMMIKLTDYTETLISDLFYGEPYKQTSGKMFFTIENINLNYYLANQIKLFENEYIQKMVYVCGDDYYASNRQFVFKGFRFINEINNLNKNEHIYKSGLITYEEKKSYLDRLCAYLEGEGNLYIAIKENNLWPINDNSLSIKGLRCLLLDECGYKRMFSEMYNKCFIDSIKTNYAGKEYFYSGNKWDNSKILISKTNSFHSYDVKYLYEFQGKYISIDSIAQIRIEQKGKFYYNYYYCGRIDNMDNKPLHIAIPISVDLNEITEDGKLHREKVLAETMERERENKERLMQLEREEKQYRSQLIRKYGKSNAETILNGEVKIGFTKAMCIEAWGSPSYVNNTISANGNWEQWVYGIGCYLYFSGNKLIVIQN